MPRCEGKTKTGARCLRMFPAGRYCIHHADQGSGDDSFLMALGAIAGHMVVPGLGGIAGGALAAKVAKALFESGPAKPKVFVSFDFDNDQGLKHLLVGQAKNPGAPFEVVDGSLKEAAPEPEWKARARTAIKGCDLVVVLVGQHTHRALGVLAEVEMAREEGKPIVQLIARRDTRYQRLPNAGRVIAWTWPNLKKLFS